jgi:hypothetical protein
VVIGLTKLGQTIAALWLLNSTSFNPRAGVALNPIQISHYSMKVWSVFSFQPKTSQVAIASINFIQPVPNPKVSVFRTMFKMTPATFAPSSCADFGDGSIGGSF